MSFRRSFFLLVLVLSQFLAAHEAILLMGPPGSGKGTFSSFAKAKGYGHISAGDLIREEILSGTALGQKLKKIVEKGEYIDPDTLFLLVEGRVRGYCDQNIPIIIDGYGKSREDWVRLNAFLDGLKLKRRLILFDAPEKVCLNRILGRLVCTNCGFITAKKFGMTAGVICPECLTDKLGPRMNDDLSITLKRLKTYQEEIRPLLLKTYEGDVVILYSSDVGIETMEKDFLALFKL